MKRFLSALILVIATPCLAQTASAKADMMQQLQKVIGRKPSSEELQQVLVIGSLLGCTQKTAGKEATEAFYRQMQTVGKTAEGYCKQGKPAEARTLLLATFAQNKDSAIVKSGLGCYDAQTANIAALGGKRMADDAAHYARWLRNPAIAEKELKETDVCKNKSVAAAQ